MVSILRQGVVTSGITKLLLMPGPKQLIMTCSGVGKCILIVVHMHVKHAHTRGSKILKIEPSEIESESIFEYLLS